MRREQWLVGQLPAGMLTDDFFTRFVSIFQEQGSTLLAHADGIEHLADPGVAPAPMARWLASWIGMDGIDPGMPEELQRRIVASAARTLAWRGTHRGLRETLELFSGGPVQVEDGGGVWGEGEAPEDTAWVVARVESTGGMHEADFIALVADEVPAHVRAELWVGERKVWPPAPGAGTSGAVASGPGASGPGASGTGTNGSGDE